jgi:vacuolar-type H+-ATPase subunit H
MSEQHRPTSSEAAGDVPVAGDPLDPPRQEQGQGQAGASAGDRAREAASTGKDEAREVASTASEQARSIASTAQGEARDVVRGANEQARRLVGDTRRELRSQANTQVDRLAQGFNDLSRQLRSMGENGEPGAARDMAREAGLRTQQMAERLRQGGVDGVIGQLRSVGRNRPGLFLFGAFGVGLVAGRVVRNLAQEPSDNGSSNVSTIGAGGAHSRANEAGFEEPMATQAAPVTSPAPDYGTPAPVPTESARPGTMGPT